MPEMPTAPADNTQAIAVKVDALTARNAKLADLLKESRTHLALLREDIERLSTPPSTFGVLLRVNTPVDTSQPTTTAEVVTAGRRMRLVISPLVDVRQLKVGVSVRLSETLTIVEVVPTDRSGDVVTLREVLEDGQRAIVATGSHEQRVVLLGERLQGEGARVLRPGDPLRVEPKSQVALEILPRSEVESLVLEEVPEVDYSDIGGLGPQIEQVRDAVELPFTHPELFAAYSLRPPKGVLLYGPPGTGKTLIAKAVAHSLAQKLAVARGVSPEEARHARSFFLNIKGPELLNKFVGESERQIRLVFQRAREKASQGNPVIVFFDEMESLFRTRGTGISSDVETTIVPQLLAEIDGVEGLDHVIVIGASNREDMIDPAILRPGRLDVKIKVDRPGQEAARDIFSKYLLPDLPLSAAAVTRLGGDRQAVIDELITTVVEAMYATTPETAYLEVTYQNGTVETLYFKDFASGAVIANIVDRAKKAAIKAVLRGQEPGITAEYLLSAVRSEFAENEDMPNTANPDDWARISGKRGERIVYVRPLVRQ